MAEELAVANSRFMYNVVMARKATVAAETGPLHWYRGPNVPPRIIYAYARQVAERFQPEKIILFGSHAYGTPHADSDVDILVIMPARNEIDQAIRIDRAVDPQFPLDLIVFTPKNLAWRLKEGDSFLSEVISKGRVLYEKAHGRMGTKGRIRLRGRQEARTRKRAPSR
jgi:predicted nucleotidyltransferase